MPSKSTPVLKSVIATSMGALLALSIAACSSTPTVDETPVDDPAPADEIHLRLLGFNDLHGSLEGPNGQVPVDGEMVDAGGVAHMATLLEEKRGEAHFTTTVAAGDIIGASPLLSALFYDEPTIEAMRLIGLDLASVGNHEFDQGVDELMRIDEGGCHEDEECVEGDEYDGASFPYLAANVRWNDNDETILPPYTIRSYGGIDVAYIGMTLEDTPSVVIPSAIEDIYFEDEVETMEYYLPQMLDEGADAVVLVIHEGGTHSGEINDINDCNDLQGPIVSIAEGMPEEVVAILSGHSHVPYVCDIDGLPVTQAGSSGRIVTTIDLLFDAASGEVVESDARNRAVSSDLEPNPQVADHVAHYLALSESRTQRVVGQITEDLPRGPRPEAGTSPIGRLIADAQLAATDEVSGAQIAFMNPGGVRDGLHFDEDSDGDVTYEALHTIQPFSNLLITMDLTGAQIHQMLEQQFNDGDRDHIMAVSSGFQYTYDPEGPYGDRVDADSLSLHGEPIDPEGTYRITVNNFLADGGDGFAVLNEGTNRVGGQIDLEALVDYVEANSPIEPPQDQRIFTTDSE